MTIDTSSEALRNLISLQLNDKAYKIKNNLVIFGLLKKPNTSYLLEKCFFLGKLHFID